MQHKAPGGGNRDGNGGQRGRDPVPAAGPARNRSEQPSITMISVVPRLGSITTSTAGMRDHAQRDAQIERLGNILHALAVQEAGKRQHQRNLHQLGRLQFQRAQGDPALRAQPDMAGHHHRDQQQQRQAIGGIGQAHPDPHIDHRHRDQDEAAHDEADDLRRGPGIETPARHRIEHGETGAGDDA